MSKKAKFKISSFKQIVIILSVVFLIFPHFALAQSITQGCEILTSQEMEALGINVDTYEPIVINFSLPGVTTEVEKNGKTEYQVKNLQCFIIGIYVYFSGVAGILATVMIMYGGVKYVISMGNPGRMGDAKDTIFSSVVGLVLVLGAYVLLNLINPNLTSLRVPGLNIASLAPVPENCTAAATPLREGYTKCGDLGTEVIVQDNPNTDEDETVEVECLYTECSYGNEICAMGRPNDEDEDRDKWFCMSPEQRCERVNFYSDSAGLVGSNPELCTPNTIPDKGKCMWIDQSWSSPYVDGCHWFPTLRCSQLGYGPNMMNQVDCNKCITAGKECKDYDMGTFSSDKEVNCLADANDNIYITYGSLAYGKFQGICCESTASTLHCWNGQNE